MGETDNGSVHVAGSVSHNAGCTACDAVLGSGHDPNGYRRHCTACHQSTHYACAECDACLPRGARWDRYYCSSSCRVKVHQWRHSPEGIAEQRARDEWRNSPEGEQLVATLRAMSAAMGDKPRRTDVEREARATATVCGRCGAPTPASQPVWKRTASGLPMIGGRSVAIIPVCYACRCDTYEGTHQARRCDECRPRGEWVAVRWSCPNAYAPEHQNIYCNGCHPRTWRAAQPCQQCGRQVMLSIYLRHGRRYPWRPAPDGTTWQEVEVRDGTFCCEDCRRVYRMDQRRAARAREPKPCAACGEHFLGRTDAAYCSTACRQRAYRSRKAVAS